MTPRIREDQDGWVIVLSTPSDAADGIGNIERTVEWHWTREGWSVGAGTALKFDTAAAARTYLARNLPLLRSTPAPRDG